MNDLILLAVLLEGPQHGYALKKRVGLITGHGDMHNNLVYPLLKRFVAKGWVTRRSARGQRGQTRELYALSAKGKNELVRSLSDFSDKTAASPAAFHFRVSLFPLLASATRQGILERRLRWLEQRDTNLARIQRVTGARGWSAEVMTFLRTEIRGEKKWIQRLSKKTK